MILFLDSRVGRADRPTGSSRYVGKRAAGADCLAAGPLWRRHHARDFSTDAASYSRAVDSPAATASKILRARPSNAISSNSGSFM